MQVLENAADFLQMVNANRGGYSSLIYCCVGLLLCSQKIRRLTRLTAFQ
jgi:hypothetical protein